MERIMKTLLTALSIIISLAASAQNKLDTLPAILKINQGNFSKYVKGYVVLNNDCKAVEFIRVNTWKKKEKLLPFDKRVTVVDWRLVN
jgi:hypothetical protein